MTEMQVFILDEEEIAALAGRFSEACDGHNAAVILVAMSDMLVALSNAHPRLTPDGVLSEFINLVGHRHGLNSSGQVVN